MGAEELGEERREEGRGRGRVSTLKALVLKHGACLPAACSAGCN